MTAPRPFGRAVYGVTGWKNAGKTRMMAMLVAELAGRGLAVSTLKHAHHAFDVDTPGKDSWTHRQAGAREVLVAGARRWALMTELRDAPEPGLAELLGRMGPADLVLVEGWKRDAHPKLEVWRPECGRPPIAAQDAGVRALAAAAEVPDAPAGLPRLDPDDAGAVADFVLADLGIGA